MVSVQGRGRGTSEKHMARRLFLRVFVQQSLDSVTAVPFRWTSIYWTPAMPFSWSRTNGNAPQQIELHMSVGRHKAAFYVTDLNSLILSLALFFLWTRGQYWWHSNSVSVSVTFLFRSTCLCVLTTYRNKLSYQHHTHFTVQFQAVKAQATCGNTGSPLQNTT